MFSNIDTFTRSIIYRANIFNYDTEFIKEFIKGQKVVDQKQFKDNTFKFSIDNISKFLSFINLPVKDQLIGFNSLTELLQDSEEGRKGTVSKEAKIVIQFLIDVLKNSFHLFTQNENERLNNQSKWDVSKISNSKLESDAIYCNITYSLLFLDGLIMNNIELSAVFDLLSLDFGIELKELLFKILECDLIGFTNKEIVSHIQSAIFIFTKTSEEQYTNLIDWMIKYYNESNGKRDNSYTSNLSLVLSTDVALDIYLEKFKSRRTIYDLINIMTKDYSINTVYESLFCIWNISNSDKHKKIFEDREIGLVEKVIQIIKTNKVEKVVRIGSLLLKNLLQSEKCKEILIDFQFIKTVKNLLSHRWIDELIKGELNETFDFLEKNNKFVK